MKWLALDDSIESREMERSFNVPHEDTQVNTVLTKKGVYGVQKWCLQGTKMVSTGYYGQYF